MPTSCEEGVLQMPTPWAKRLNPNRGLPLIGSQSPRPMQTNKQEFELFLTGQISKRFNIGVIHK